MGILFLLAVAILCFGLLFVGKKFRYTILYTLAIGGAINSNFFNAGAYPIYAFGLPFGIDSILYTLFVFCVIFSFFKYSKKDAYLLMISSVLAIGFAAVMQYLAGAGSMGFENQANLFSFLGFLISIFATFLAVVSMLEFLSFLHKKGINYYVCILLGIILATVVNSIVYYSLTTLLSGGISENFFPLLWTSLIGKGIALVFSLLTAFLLEIFDKRKSLL